MSQTQTREVIADKATIHSDISQRLTPKVDRSFGLPSGLYAVTAGCYLGFLAILATAVSTPGLIIPLAICAVFIGMFFAVPSMILHQTPQSEKFVKSWGQLKSRGISTYTGHLSGTEAAVQVLILPVLVIAWGLAIALVIALV